MSRTAASAKPVKVAKTQAEILFYRSNEKPYGAFSNLLRRNPKMMRKKVVHG